MSIKSWLKKFKLVRQMVEKRKLNKKFNSKFTFIDRSKGSETLCYILAGYKSNLWDIVFDRIKQFVPSGADVCILSSGLYNEKLNKITEDNNWSYLYTNKNNISIVQNICLREFKSAKNIYKIDEDIFITEGFFENLEKCYNYVASESIYTPGIIAPVIPVNGYGYIKILEKYNLSEKYEQLFEKPVYGSDVKIFNQPEVAKFMWGEGGYLPSIDQMNKDFKKPENKFSVCPMRFSIGAIYFKRELWEKLDYFNVIDGIDLGIDEFQMCCYCVDKSKPIVVCENSVVGHLSFGPQNKEMEKYFLSNIDKFKIEKTKND